jgi:hypothetical protein
MTRSGKLPNQTIARFYRDGASPSELAATWGVSLPTIHAVLQDAGLPPPRRRGRPRSSPDLSLPDGGIGLSRQSMAYHRRINQSGR